MSKYHAKKTPCNQGHIHDSKKEAKRCDALHERQARGEIQDLQVQVKIQLLPATKYKELDSRMENERSYNYIADFKYVENGKSIIEDVKGVKTDAYKGKRKLVKFLFCRDGGVSFIET